MSRSAPASQEGEGGTNDGLKWPPIQSSSKTRKPGKPVAAELPDCIDEVHLRLTGCLRFLPGFANLQGKVSRDRRGLKLALELAPTERRWKSVGHLHLWPH